jgi:drug/metabolite transporter (DMT)-like permease
MARGAAPALHTTSGRWRLGLALSLGAVFMWGFLPIALGRLLEQMGALTITWYRFLVAGLVLALPVLRSRGLAPVVADRRSILPLLGVATAGLVTNYLLFVLSLHYVPPSAAQVIIQLAPMCLLLGSLLVFRERFVAVQRAGLAVLLAGLVLFFHNDLPALRTGESPLIPGLALLLGAAVAWGSYALAQKQLLRTMSSPSIMMAIYLGSAVVLLPFARPADVAALDRTGLGLLAFLSLNTLAAYGCFSEALQHLEASRVSLVMALTPLATISAVTLGARVLPSLITAESIDAPSLVGAALVVAGSMLGALGRKANPDSRLPEALSRPSGP